MLIKSQKINETCDFCTWSPLDFKMSYVKPEGDLMGHEDPKSILAFCTREVLDQNATSFP